MDLALALGRDVGSMSEREFRRWQMYFRRKSFPLRKLEFCVARLTAMVAQTMGGAENASMHDYMFNPSRDENGILIDPTEESVINENDL